LLISFIFFPQEIAKKKYPQYNEDNKEFDEDYNPDTPAPPRHIPETLTVKSEYPVYC